MNTNRLNKIIAALICMLLVVGCGNNESYDMVEREALGETSGAFETSADSAEYAEEVAYESETAGQSLAVAQAPSQRLIIKSAQLSLNVDNTDVAVASATDLVISVGGYIVDQNIYTFGQDHRAASISLGVPVDQFENALKSLRAFGEVESESASGQDVTEEYVDLNSRLENLQATQARLRQFLVDATNVEEALAVDQELRQVEGELNVIQGRIKYLADRAAFSTITLEIRPIIIAAQPAPQTWQPAAVAQQALVTLQDGLQSFVDGTIIFVITVLPWLLIWGAILTIFGRFGLKLYRRVRPEGSAETPAQPMPEAPAA